MAKPGRPKKLIPPAPPKPDPPPQQLPENQIVMLASIGCTNEEIAAFLGVSADTITRNFAEAITKGKLQGHVSIKRKLYALATGDFGKDQKPAKPNLGALIWFGKQFMGWKDEVIHTPSEELKDQIKVVYTTSWGSTEEKK